MSALTINTLTHRAVAPYAWDRVRSICSSVAEYDAPVGKRFTGATHRRRNARAAVASTEGGATTDAPEAS